MNDFNLHVISTWLELNGIYLSYYGMSYNYDYHKHKPIIKPIIKVICPSHHYIYSEDTYIEICGIKETVKALNISRIEEDIKKASIEVYGKNIFDNVVLSFDTNGREWLEYDHLKAKDAVRYQYINSKRISDI